MLTNWLFVGLKLIPKSKDLNIKAIPTQFKTCILYEYVAAYFRDIIALELNIYKLKLNFSEKLKLNNQHIHWQWKLSATNCWVFNQLLDFREMLKLTSSNVSYCLNQHIQFMVVRQSKAATREYLLIKRIAGRFSVARRVSLSLFYREDKECRSWIISGLIK